MSNEPNRNVYVGHRYVPKIMGEWDKQQDYEGLSIVTYQGNSYTSKKRVPVGIDILNEEFWVVTGNYNAQVDYYRQETERVADDLLLKSDQTYVDTELGKKADKSYTDNELGKKADQTYTDTELGKKADQTYVDTELGEVNNELGTKVNNEEFEGFDITLGLYNPDLTGSNDTVNTFNLALSEHDNIIVPSGDYLLDSTLIIPRDKKVHFQKGVTLLINHNGIGIDIRQKAVLTGRPVVSPTNPNYSGSAVFFDGSLATGSAVSSFEDTFIDGLIINGDRVSGMGNGLHFKTDVSPSQLSFLKFSNISVSGFEKLIFLDAPPLNGDKHNYINGVQMDNVFLRDGDYYIYMSGDHSELNQTSGNTFYNVQFQYSNRCKEMIHVEGRSNYIDGYMWDISYKDALMVNLTNMARNNRIVTNLTVADNYRDYGTDNYINFREFNEVHKPTLKATNNQRRDQKGFKGEYEDIFHGANHMHDVSFLSGSDRVKAGALDNLFNGEINTGMYLNLEDNREAVIEMVLNGNAYKQLSETDYFPRTIETLGLTFRDARPSKEIIIEVEDIDGVVSETRFEMENRRNDNYIFMNRNTINGLSSTRIKKIRFRFIGQLSTDVRIDRIMASSTGVGASVRYLSNLGGKVYGNVEIEGDIKVSGSVTAGIENKDLYIPFLNVLPSRVVSNRGKMILFQDGTIDHDELRILLQQSDGSYEWITIGSGVKQ